MPVFVDAVLDDALDAGLLLTSYISLHTAYSATGTNEVTGGSPAYARQLCAWDAAATRVADNTAQEVFDVPASTTVSWLGFWSAVTSGTFYGMVPLGNTLLVPCVGNSSDDYIYAAGHGLSNDDRVAFLTLGGGSMATGLTEGTLYWVVSSATDRFQVSTSQGGAAVTLTGSATMIVANAVSETFASQGTLTIAAGDLDVTAVF